MKTILVTGGAGFIGSHLVEELAKNNFHVHVLDSLIKGKLSSIQYLIDEKKVTFFEGDIRNRDMVDKSMQGVDYVFHTAGIHIKKSSDSPEDEIEVNVHGSYNVFKSALDHKVKRVVFSSSSSVYGNPKVLPMKENSEINIVEPYGASKLMCENLLEFLGKQGLKYNILRYFNVYGPRFNPDGAYALVIDKFLKQKKEGKPLTITGDGKQTRDFTHVSDVVNANLLAAENSKVVNGEIINIGTGNKQSINKIAELVGGAIEYIPARLEPHDTLADNSRAHKILGWSPRVSIKEGITELLK